MVQTAWAEISGAPSGLSFATAWTPASLSPLEWWDPYDAATFTFSSGSVVSSWASKGSGASALTQSTGSAQPSRTSALNGSVVAFDTSDYLVTASFGSKAQPNTICSVVKFATHTPVQWRYIYDGIAGTDRHAILTRTDTFSGKLDFYAGAEGQPTPAADTSWHIIVCEYNGASSKVWIDGGASTTLSLGTNALTGLTLSARYTAADFGNISAADVIIGDSWSLTDLNLLGNYLATKHGLTWSTAS